LKAEIAAKLDSKGVKDYELNISDSNEKGAGKIVGTCEDGSKKIVYSKQKRSAAAAQSTAAEEPAPVVAVRMVPAAEEPPKAGSAAVKSCAELKAEIAARLDSKGVQHYTLIILNKSAGSPGQVVGVCENGSQKIIYAKTR